MTPDELPDDMEAVERRIQQDMDDVSDVWRHCRIAFVDAADPDDVVGFPSFTKADLRALLKAYQEQRRALEELIDHADQCMARLDYHDACIMGDEPVQAARAALNQKGDER